MKNEVIKYSRQLQKYPNNPVVRQNLFTSLKLYNRTRKRKARNYKANLIHELDELRTSSPQKYWNLLNSLKEPSRNENPAENIPMGEWELYFRDLNKKKDNEHDKDMLSELETMENQPNFCELDFSIKPSEITKAIKMLKNNKAPGLDKISNEMIKYSQHAMLPVLTNMFNKILRSGFYPKIWTEGYIVPIYKKNDKSDPINYRGITITNTLSKLFNSVLNQRISNHLINNDTISKCQIGFKKGSRTSDHIYLLKSLIDRYISKGQHLYTCFVDLKKAFDKVNHVKLLYKLQKAGIKGSVYNLIKDMYYNVKLRLGVKIGNYLSNSFDSDIGLGQGDVMSPTLFNLYINDLVGNYLNRAPDPAVLHNTQLNCLLYADDLVILSESQQGLQHCMDQLSKFNDDWDMDINLDKTETLVFNKKGKFIKPKITYKGLNIRATNSSKYLGIYFQSSGNFTIAKKDLAQRASKAMFKLTKSLSGIAPSINTFLHLFDHTVKPILLYGSEIWGGFLLDSKKELYDKWLADEIEKCHLQFIRYILNVNRRTPKIALYGETGRFPLLNEICCNIFKYWLRIRELPPNTLLYDAYISNVEIYPRKNWACAIEILAQKLEVSRKDILLPKSKPIQKLKMLLRETFIRKWEHDLFDDSRKNNTGNKLRTYRLFKTNFRLEQYLLDVRSDKCKKKLAQFRLSSHHLHIETGRRCTPYKEPSERICNYCSSRDIEDELHFVLKCTLYKDLRCKFYEQVVSHFPVFKVYNNDEKFVWLCANLDTNVLNLFAEFIHDCFEKRALSTPTI